MKDLGFNHKARSWIWTKFYTLPSTPLCPLPLPQLLILSLATLCLLSYPSPTITKQTSWLLLLLPLLPSRPPPPPHHRPSPSLAPSARSIHCPDPSPAPNPDRDSDLGPTPGGEFGCSSQLRRVSSQDCHGERSFG